LAGPGRVARWGGWWAGVWGGDVACVGSPVMRVQLQCAIVAVKRWLVASGLFARGPVHRVRRRRRPKPTLAVAWGLVGFA